MTEKKDIAVIGAGPAGLTAAREISVERQFNLDVFEKSGVVGGISRTENHGGYRVDIGGHRFFTKNEAVNALWQKMLGDDFLSVKRTSRIYYQGKFFRYPLQFWNTILHLGARESVLVSLSYLKALLFPAKEEKTFDQWVSNRFGRRLYRLFFKEYTEKVWGRPCSAIQADWAAQRIKGLSFPRAVSNAILGSNGSKSMIESFRYPRLGPGMMWDRFLEDVLANGGRAHLSSAVTRLSHENGRIVSLSYLQGDTLHVKRVDQVISSIPLNRLVQLLVPQVPPHVLEAAAQLRYRDFMIVVLVIDQAEIFPDQWLYIHCPNVRVGRIQNFKNWSRDMVPDQQTTSLGLEYFCNRDDDIWNQADDELIRRAKEELAEIGFAGSRNVLAGHVIRQPYAYPIYDGDYQHHVAVIKEYLKSFHNLQTIGRNGMHRYNNMDHSMLTGLLAAQNLAGARHDVWKINAGDEYLEETANIN